MTLAELKIGQDAVIGAVGGAGELRHHLLDMGLTPGTEVTLRKVAPMGDPIEVELRGYELTLRLDDAAKITVHNVHDTDRAARSEARHAPVPHPGVGEFGKTASYHARKAGPAIAKGAPLTFALAGNQNCGKTTLFNQLTGSNQHVGNFPGVTVDRKDGVIRGHAEATVTDLPGIYSLSPYSSEEIVTRDFILQQKPNGIINIVDATNIERNLYLTMQLMELQVPMVLALNMMDEVRANGGTILVNELETILGIPVVPISAAKNEGIDELIDHALHVARHRELPGRIDFCTAGDGPSDPRGAVHRCIHAVAHLIEDHAAAAGLPLRFASTKLVEGDGPILEALALDQNEKELLDHTITELEAETGLDREAALADMRFAFIEKLCAETVVKPGESREHKRSVAIDRVLTGKYTALPCFVGIMALVFWLTFGVIGVWLSDAMTLGIDALTALVDGALAAYGINPVVHSLVIDGIFAGVGSVLSFLPTIVTLFFFLSILEDTGYMARVAFVMDKLLRRIGLSGRSFCADAHRLRLLGAGHHGHAHAVQRPRPPHDHSADAVHELLGQVADLRAVYGGVFPAGLARAGHDLFVSVRHRVRHFVRRAAQTYPVPRRAGALCDGAAQLPPAQRPQRGAADLGQSQGLCAARVHHHLCGDGRDLVLADL